MSKRPEISQPEPLPGAPTVVPPVRPPASGATIRAGAAGDLDALVDLEERCFTTDRISRRSFRRFLARPTARCLVAERAGRIVGYALVLFRSGTALARLYSIAVDQGVRSQGLAGHLLDAAERTAYEHDCIFMRLEVRADNPSATRLYRSRGYRQFGRYLDYYDDHADAVRFEKPLFAFAPPPDNAPPYYAQTTDFTCGPACMMMALGRFERSTVLDRRLELRLWREATTIFMTSGHGGCEPYGMAVALARRGLQPEIYVSTPGPLFLDGVRSAAKREVMLLTQEEFREDALALGIPIRHEPLSRQRLAQALDAGGLAIVLVSTYRAFSERRPHWVLVHGRDDRHVFVHDPWVDEEDFETAMATANLPIPTTEFERMARYGRHKLRAAVVVAGEARA